MINEIELKDTIKNYFRRLGEQSEITKTLLSGCPTYKEKFSEINLDSIIFSYETLIESTTLLRLYNSSFYDEEMQSLEELIKPKTDIIKDNMRKLYFNFKNM